MGSVTGSGSSPTNAEDFGGVLPGDAATIPTDNLSASVIVDVSGDIDAENNEGFTVTLSNASARTSTAAASAIGTILNDDATPVFEGIEPSMVLSPERSLTRMPRMV